MGLGVLAGLILARLIRRRYEDRLAYWISEKDRGQVHAINKGLERTTGDIFAFINSGDVYVPGAFAAVAEHFGDHERRRHPRP